MMEQWQAMLRDTGQHIGSPRTASVAEMEGRAIRLPGVVWYSITSGDVVYANEYHLLVSRSRGNPGTP